ncbi:MAG: adenosine deaminase [Firmicutes bacterium ZCTH02-B6]|nr:MAG: adenosine deaminase [Firmicutes bacterium ZCTH02-B6]
MPLDLAAMPKIELHLHLDGSVRPATVWELLQEGRRREAAAVARYAALDSLEAVTAAMQVPDDCPSLADYLTRFDLPLAVMQDEEALERIAYELVADVAAENVVHAEVRFAPVLHTAEGLSMRAASEAVLRGLARGQREFGVTTGLIACCMRHLPAQDNTAMVRAVEPLLGAGLVAIDLAGDEARFPGVLHREPLQLAREMGFHVIVHAGEASGAEEVRTALDVLGAERIGHGVRLEEDPDLLREVAERGIALEMCPTSNVQTKAVGSLETHPLRRYLEAGITATVNTDNRTVSNTTLTAEYRRVVDGLGLGPEQVQRTVYNAAANAFLPPAEKQALLDRLERELGRWQAELGGGRR